MNDKFHKSAEIKKNLAQNKIIQIKEAAIKWQRGSLAADLIHWRCGVDSAFAVHELLGHQVDVHRIHHNIWSMAVVSDLSAMSNSPMLCLV